MKKKYVYWREDDMWLGYLEDYPDYWTQGETEDALRENLLDLYSELLCCQRNSEMVGGASF